MTSQSKQWSSPPAMEIDAKKTYTATFNTDKGDIIIHLLLIKFPKR